MTALAEASLTDAERRTLDRLVALLAEAFGPRLRSVWLYGSRARGETPHEESDIDLLVVVDPERPEDRRTVVGLAVDAESEIGLGTVLLSPLVYSSERVAQRREIGSFFLQEVDRDKVVLYGEP
ncbi:MAG TPA: nucleotidyltransferase domain-containing protein [Gaiellaceae bacterium]|jgi:predicted nucleotidyltransferase|nr:nucleotidyltransferase domain-containing protein [Gaiellaceae bacterium]